MSASCTNRNIVAPIEISVKNKTRKLTCSQQTFLDTMETTQTEIGQYDVLEVNVHGRNKYQ